MAAQHFVAAVRHPPRELAEDLAAAVVPAWEAVPAAAAPRWEAAPVVVAAPASTGRGDFAGPRRGYRGGGHRHHRHAHRRWRGGGVYFGAPYYYGAWGPSYYYDDFYDAPYYDDVPVASYDDDDVERCAARYRSFDRRTGTFLTYGGERRLCPYLR